jgi:hypothetical protein
VDDIKGRRALYKSTVRGYDVTVKVPEEPASFFKRLVLMEDPNKP